MLLLFISINKWTNVTILKATQVIVMFWSFCSGISDIRDYVAVTDIVIVLRFYKAKLSEIRKLQMCIFSIINVQLVLSVMSPHAVAKSPTYLNLRVRLSLKREKNDRTHTIC